MYASLYSCILCWLHSISILSAPDDYLFLALTVVISPGEISRDVAIVILPDRVLELNEQFTVSLSSTDEDRVTLTPNQTVTTIEIIDTTSGELHLV